MKTVYLVRHASTSEREASQKDVERNLSDKGQQEAKRMAKLLNDRGSIPDIWISSEARRAMETAHIFAEILDYSTQKIQLNNKIIDKLCDVRNEFDDKSYEIKAIQGTIDTLSAFKNLLQADFDKARIE